MRYSAYDIFGLQFFSKFYFKMKLQK